VDGWRVGHIAMGIGGSVAWNGCSSGWNGCKPQQNSGPAAAFAVRAAIAPLTSTATKRYGGSKKSSANSKRSSIACGMPKATAECDQFRAARGGASEGPAYQAQSV